MSDNKAGASVLVDMGLAGAVSEDNAIGAPRFTADFECIGEDGTIRWKTGFKNVVVNDGKGYLLAKMFGSTSRAADTWYLGLHNAATASTHAIGNITASEVSAYAGNRPVLAFATGNSSVGSTTVTASISFSAGSQAVTGAFICANAAGISSTVGGVLYSEGNFGAARTVVTNDTLNMTVTVQFT